MTARPRVAVAGFQHASSGYNRALLKDVWEEA